MENDIGQIFEKNNFFHKRSQVSGSFVESFLNPFKKEFIWNFAHEGFLIDHKLVFPEIS